MKSIAFLCDGSAKGAEVARLPSSTGGSELVAARIATDLIIEMRYVLRMLGVKVEKESLLLGDNMSVVLNTTIPSSQLKKKHNVISYHRVREAIAARIVKFAHVISSENIADILTKSMDKATFIHLTKKCLFVPSPGCKEVPDDSGSGVTKKGEC